MILSPSSLPPFSLLSSSLLPPLSFSSSSLPPFSLLSPSLPPLPLSAPPSLSPQGHGQGAESRLNRQRREIQRKLEKTRTQLAQEKKDYRETQTSLLQDLEVTTSEKTHTRSGCNREAFVCSCLCDCCFVCCQSWRH